MVKRWLPRLALLLGSTVLALLLGEAACRFQVHNQNQRTLQNALENPPPLSPGKPATLRSIIQLSLDDRIAYELRPDMKKVNFKGAPLSTNSRGFRSPEYPEIGPADSVTIVGLGDSIMFGHGVGDGEPYLDLLGERLTSLHPERAWRVINSGVPGYNTVMEVTTLEQKLLAFEPDLVILGLCANDFAPPNYVRVEEDVWDASRSFLLDRVRGMEAVSETFREEGLSNRAAWNRETGGEAPSRYADLVGREPALQAMARLGELSEQHGFEVLAVLIYETSGDVEGRQSPEDALLAASQEYGFHVVRMQDQITEVVEAETGEPFSWDHFAGSTLAVSKGNQHPSTRLHRMTALELFKSMRDSGLLDRLVSP